MKLLLFALTVVCGFSLFSPAIAADTGVDLQDCRIYAGPGFPGIKARCGILLRPLNPADPASPHIDLHVAVVPALTLQPEPDAFVPIAGGPGQSSIEFYAAQAGAFEKIRRKRDIVLLDQRGTGDSSPMNCELDDAAVGNDMDAAEIREATEECLEVLPQDPRYFTTSIAVQDLDALRDELGYSQFNLYGVSYGSRVAQHYARRYPDTTRTVILDGVVPPQLALGPEIALEAQRALQNVFDRCAEDDACRERFGDLEKRFAALKAQLDEAPVTVKLPDPTTGKPDVVEFGNTELSGALRLLSYHPTTIALIPLLVSEAADGNFVPLAAQHVLSSSAMEEAISIGMHNAVVCTEDTPFYKESELPREALAQTYIGPIMLESMQTMCEVWPAGVIDDGFKEPLATSLPVLLLSGAEDPITPPGYAERAMVELNNAKHLIGRNQGHGLAPRGCVPNVLAEFVNTAALADLDTTCMERLFAMPFFLDFSGPAP
ncbi:MAG: alpha/beta fold hydrolase [Woeseia sp.]|nr:alpha/beta hydrolase [Woeseia sp.]NNE60148.1 alpha/beta fold hydrolase [Woeseia sp.]NNL53854.1 alpha/beta fold hydrolase [Woeseia sp.]